MKNSKNKPLKSTNREETSSKGKQLKSTNRGATSSKGKQLKSTNRGATSSKGKQLKSTNRGLTSSKSKQLKSTNRRAISSKGKQLKSANREPTSSRSKQLKSTNRGSTSLKDKQLKSARRGATSSRGKELKSTNRATTSSRSKQLKSTNRESTSLKDKQLKSAKRRATSSKDKQFKSTNREVTSSKSKQLKSTNRGSTSSRGKQFKSAKRGATPSRGRNVPQQIKPSSKSSSGGFFHTTKGKVISIIVGLLVLGGAAAGIGIGLTSGDSTSESTKASNSQYQNLKRDDERQLQRKLDEFDEDYKDALIDYILTKDSSKTRNDLINKSLEDLKKEVFIIFDRDLGSSSRPSFADLFVTLQVVTLDTWRNALNELARSDENRDPISVFTPFVEVNDQPLTSQVMEQFDLVDKLPKLISDVSITYSHPALDQDGELLLTLKITIGNNPPLNKELLFTIQVDLELYLRNTNDYISSLDPKTYAATDAKPTPDSGGLTSANANQFFTFADGVSFNLPNDQVLVFYQITSLGTYEFEVTFTITRNDSLVTTNTFTTTITYYMGDRDVNAAYDDLNLLTIKPIEIDDQLSAIDNAIFDENLGNDIFYDYSPPDNVSIKYSHPLFDGGNKLTYTLYITKGDVTREFEIDVPVASNDVKNTINALESLSKDAIIHTSEIAAVTDWTDVTDDLFTNIIKQSKPSYSSNVQVQYKIPTALAEDGDLTVQFRVRDNGESTWALVEDYVVSVTGVSLSRTRSIINGLSSSSSSTTLENLEDLNHENPIYAVTEWTPISDELFTNILKKDVPSWPSNVDVEYQILNSVLKPNDRLDIRFRFKLKSSSGDGEIITKSWVVDNANYALHIKHTFDGLSSTTPIQRSTTIPAVTDWTDITDDLFTSIIQKDRPIFPEYDIQYQIPDELINNGTLTIIFRIALSTTSGQANRVWTYAECTIEIIGLGTP